MDLETFLPLLLLAVAYLYRAFENAAKNKKAGPAAPAEGQPPGKVSRGAPAKGRRVAPDRPGTPGGSAAPDRPATSGKPVTSVLRSEGRDLSGTPAAAPRSAFYPELPEEVLRAREARRRAGTASASSGTVAASGGTGGTPAHSGSGNPASGPGALEEAGEGEYAAAGFDLRDAVIKAAILERRDF